MTDSLIILVAEDEETDAFLLRRAFQKAGLSNQIVVARDGQEAVDYLEGHGAFEDRDAYPLPGLILLDLKMPRMDGFDVLAWLNTRPDLKNVPVIVLSSSDQPSDIEQARKMGACDYRVKPHEFSQLVQLVQELGRSWLTGVS